MEDQSTNVKTTPTANPNTKKKDHIRMLILLIFLAVAIVAAFFWWRNYNRFITTDDANIDSNRVNIAPMVTGKITNILVEEGDSVKKGDLLFTIDDALIKAKRLEAEAQHMQLEAQVAADRIQIKELEDNVKITSLTLSLSKKDFDRAKAQYQGGAITTEVYQQYEQKYRIDQYQYSIAKSRINTTVANIDAALKSVEASEANIAAIDTELAYYQVKANEDGVIAKRWMLPGDIVAAGESVYTLNTDENMWVMVYLEETKYDNIHLGQEAIFTLDAYDKLKFKGHIYYIGENTSSEFALIPPNNASGNFTKVTQRIPVKISIDQVDGDKKQKKSLRLVSGLSATVKIEKK